MLASKIRFGQSDDLASIQNIFNEVIASVDGAIYTEVPLSDKDIEDWWAKKVAAEHPILVAEEHGQVVGFATYGPFRERKGYASTAELAVHVTSLSRGKGIGSSLIQTLLSEAKARGIHTMIAGIDSQNAGSLRLHEKLGFEKVAEMKQIAKTFGKWRDLIFMQKML